ncbi:MAG: RNA-binding protein [Alphaproteobacteria bacterium]|nr:RNA-binding protein [Alphaproteobacteria bacterium]
MEIDGLDGAHAPGDVDRPTDGAPDSATDPVSGPASGPLRRCIVTGVVRPKDALIRFVVSPEGVVTPDILNKLPGRGIWVSTEQAALERAVARNHFAKAARRAVSVPPDLPARVEALLVKRCIDGVSRARRAGQAVAGFEKTAAALAASKWPAGVYITALDGAEGGAAKLGAAARNAGATRVLALTRAELGAAFGREDTVHAALQRGGLATTFVVDSKRLAGLRPGASVTDPKDPARKASDPVHEGSEE